MKKNYILNVNIPGKASEPSPYPELSFSSFLQESSECKYFAHVLVVEMFTSLNYVAEICRNEKFAHTSAQVLCIVATVIISNTDRITPTLSPIRGAQAETST